MQMIKYDEEDGCLLDAIYECPSPPDTTTPATYVTTCTAIADNHRSCATTDQGQGICEFHSSQG